MKNPKPGLKLQKMTREYDDLHNEIVYMSEKVKDMTTSQFSDAIKKRVKKWKKNPDLYKYIGDMLLSRREHFRQSAEKALIINELMGWANSLIKDDLVKHMEKKRLKTLRGNTWKVSLRKSEPKLDIDPKKLSSRYLVTETVRVPNSRRIQVDLQKGVKVPGAKLVRRLEIYGEVIKRASNGQSK